MQDVRAVGGGRLFGGGDRRVRQHNHQAAALKCPRCDSFNTKFCYYNNYNLSQPRHFCKGCRRYWTKGGVLRNVPVGGGCRKTKRSKKSGGRESHARSSSSESSNLTAAAAAAAASMKTSDLKNDTPSSAVACDFSDSRFVNTNPNFDYPVNNPSTDGQIFANLTTEFGITNISTTSYGLAQKESRDPGPKVPSPLEASKLQEINTEGLPTTTTAEVLELGWGSGPGDGGVGDDEELFDLTAAVDPAYWSQPQWTDGGDPSLNFLS